MKDLIETQTSFGRYYNASEHVHDRIRHDQGRMSKISAMQMLGNEAFASGVSDKSLDDIWASGKERAQNR